MAYFEGEIPTVVTSNGNGNGSGMWNDSIWAILLLALLGYGNRGGYGLGGGGYGAGSEFVGYQ